MDQRDKIQVHLTVGRYQFVSLGRFHKPLDQLHPLEGGGSRQKQQEELQSCSLQKGDHKHTKLDNIRWQRNMFQMKEQDKNPQEQLNEMEIGNLPEK